MLLSFLIILTLGKANSAEFKKHVPNSVYPFDFDPPNYSIGSWAEKLHLQQCAFVEVGDNYFAIFVESRPRRYDKEKRIREYFVGLCDDVTLKKWLLCSPSLKQKREEDCCLFVENMYGDRVHRRLCDITSIALNAPQCDCSNELSDSKLFNVQGFPTCFKAPLPESLCGDNNVCGLYACRPETVNKKIHSVTCDRKCDEQQPFCEVLTQGSSQPRKIASFWTDWSNPFCTDVSCLSQYDEATCINRNTGEGDIDCLGPGTSCCTAELQNCRCHVYEENGVAKVFRTFSIPPPELVEYMSEEDFINSIPLRYLTKEEFHKYPYNSPRTVRSPDIGRTFKEVIYTIYDHRPIKFGNTYKHEKRKRLLSRFKSSIMRIGSCKRQAPPCPTGDGDEDEKTCEDFQPVEAEEDELTTTEFKTDDPEDELRMEEQVDMVENKTGMEQSRENENEGETTLITTVEIETVAGENVTTGLAVKTTKDDENDNPPTTKATILAKKKNVDFDTEDEETYKAKYITPQRKINEFEDDEDETHILTEKTISGKFPSDKHRRDVEEEDISDDNDYEEKEDILIEYDETTTKKDEEETRPSANVVTATIKIKMKNTTMMDADIFNVSTTAMHHLKNRGTKIAVSWEIVIRVVHLFYIF